MLELISTISKKLHDDGFSRGDRIAVCSDACIEYYCLCLACWKTGVVIAPVSTRYPDKTLSRALERIDFKNLLISRSLKRDLSNCQCRILEDVITCHQNETSSVTFEQFQFDLDADASILFTSGSSGEPKGVLHTIGNHYYNALGALQNIPFERGDRWLVSLPMYHISGFSLIMRSLITGGTLVFPAAGESVSDALQNKKITHLSLVPAQLQKFTQDPDTLKALRQCKSILLGGSAFSDTLIRQALDQGLPLSTTYGLTESSSQVATTRTDELKKKSNTSGRILPYRELKISEDGEILLKGPTLFEGYVLRNRVELPLDAHGYFHTGDIGTLDKEGFLTVTGRKDRMFISGGENIYPEEIEKAILSMGFIEQVCVVPVPDEAMGQRPVAFIKTPQQPPKAETLRSYLQTCLERFKIPIAFLPWPRSAAETLKPDSRFFQQIASETMAEKHRS